MIYQEPHNLAILAHASIGTLGLLLYWSALTSQKGSALHKTSGRWFLVVLIWVSLSVAPVLFLRPGQFDPAYVVQMVYLVACLCTVSFIAWSAIRWKTEVDRFRGRHFLILGCFLFALGAFVFVAGLIGGNPVALVLSWVGLVFGPAMIAFHLERRPLHPRWWLGWHLNSISALFNAVHGTFLYVVAVHAGLFSEGTFSKVFFQLVTIAGAIVMRLWLGARYDVPLRFTAEEYGLTSQSHGNEPGNAPEP